MNESEYNNISAILTDLTLFQKQIIISEKNSLYDLREIKLPEKIQEIENIIDNKLENNIQYFTNNIINQLSKIINEYQDYSQSAKKVNTETSFLFNPLNFFKIGETIHSKILGYLLNPYSNHGQDKMFIEEFLKLLGITVNSDDHWIVTAETGRIDILLKRLNPKTTIIIENKSNFAEDQNNQLYRYWYQEIFYPNRWRENAIEFASSNEQMQIIYLTPADWKLPSNNSLERPNYLDKKLPNILPIKPKIFLFNEHIVKWLNNSLARINIDNHRLKEFIYQYIELWN